MTYETFQNYVIFNKSRKNILHVKVKIYMLHLIGHDIHVTFNREHLCLIIKINISDIHTNIFFNHIILT